MTRNSQSTQGLLLLVLLSLCRRLAWWYFSRHINNALTTIGCCRLLCVAAAWSTPGVLHPRMLPEMMMAAASAPNAVMVVMAEAATTAQRQAA
jgi:hypothetical protein